MYALWFLYQLVNTGNFDYVYDFAKTDLDSLVLFLILFVARCYGMH